MEHTHLVKGLDFALLQKVRSEIVNRERAAEEDEQLMKEIEKKEADPKTLVGLFMLSVLFKGHSRGESF